MSLTTTALAMAPTAALAVGWGTHVHYLRGRLRSRQRDPLTGALRRDDFQVAGARVLRCTSDSAVMLVDVNDFKSVNDTLGHDVGDLVLVELADRLRQSLPVGAVVGRLGGDEFAVAVPRIQRSPELRAAEFDTVLSALREPIHDEQGRVIVTPGASVGVAPVADAPDATWSELLKRADLAMYSAKHEYRLRRGWDVYTPARHGAALVTQEPQQRTRHHGVGAMA